MGFFKFYFKSIYLKNLYKGIMIYYSGRIYEGEWLNDSKFGKGFELYPNGNAYEG
jgi:hypothetical protein